MRNVLLIVVDTLRPDHLGCYGYGRPVSPHLDALAAEGCLLDKLWSASNFTAPAFTSLFTGLYPHQHGIYDFTARAGASAVRRTLDANGVRTGAVVTFRFFGHLLGRIWDDIEAVTDTRSADYAPDLPQAVTASALDWLERHGSAGPFALFLHYDGPHMPYRLPAPYADAFDTVDAATVDSGLRDLVFPQEREVFDDRAAGSMFRLIERVNWGRKRLDAATLQWVQDKYDASVRYNDAAIGDLLAGVRRLGLADDTVVAVLSDHGEEFLEHGSLAHGDLHLYEEVVRTVGIIRDPAASGGGRRLVRPLSQVDLWPTLLTIAGAADLPPGWGEREFSGELAGAAAAGPERPVFCHGKAKVAVRRGRDKLILPRPDPALGRAARLRLWAKMALRRELGAEVYDLAADPSERRNLARDGGRRAPLAAALSAHLAARGPAPDAAADLADDQRRRIEQEMKDLGYM